MGHFKNQLINDYDDKDPQKYCSECNEQISDNQYYDYKGLCNECVKK